MVVFMFQSNANNGTLLRDLRVMKVYKGAGA
jgi:hypothetical protein